MKTALSHKEVAMSRHDVTDREWKSIRVYLRSERTGKAGRPWISHRKVLNGILWILNGGGSWRDLPVEYGKWSTVYSRFRRWCRNGLWNRIMKSLLRKLDSDGKIDRRLWCVDGTLVRAIAQLQEQYNPLAKKRTIRHLVEPKEDSEPSFIC